MAKSAPAEPTSPANTEVYLSLFLTRALAPYDNELDNCEEEMSEVRCPRCEIRAYDTASPLFGSPHLIMKDEDCSFFVAGRDYMLKCKYVRGRRDGFISVADNPCPTLKNALASTWRTPALVG